MKKQNNERGVCLGYPRPPPGSLIKERNLQNSVCDLFCQKDTKQKQQKKKGTRGKVWRKQSPGF